MYYDIYIYIYIHARVDDISLYIYIYMYILVIMLVCNVCHTHVKLAFGDRPPCRRGGDRLV